MLDFKQIKNLKYHQLVIFLNTASIKLKQKRQSLSESQIPSVTLYQV